MKNIFKNYSEYINDNPKGYWFKKKLYGWGWTPVKWQGWLVIVAYVFLVVALSLNIDKNLPADQFPLSFFVTVIIMTILLIYIAYKTGEKPSWQWGRKNKKDNKDDKNGGF